jgi:hypothetical protein
VSARGLAGAGVAGGAGSVGTPSTSRVGADVVGGGQLPPDAVESFDAVAHPELSAPPVAVPCPEHTDPLAATHPAGGGKGPPGTTTRAPGGGGFGEHRITSESAW